MTAKVKLLERLGCSQTSRLPACLPGCLAGCLSLPRLLLLLATVPSITGSQSGNHLAITQQTSAAKLGLKQLDTWLSGNFSHCAAALCSYLRIVVRQVNVIRLALFVLFLFSFFLWGANFWRPPHPPPPPVKVHIINLLAR